jgi:hypothetical protein
MSIILVSGRGGTVAAMVRTSLRRGEGVQSKGGP